MTATPPGNVSPSSETFLRAIELTLIATTPVTDTFEATTQYVPWPKAYGGDMVSQSASAMMRTVTADRHLHSMHSYFMRPVDIGSTVRYEVERLRDGRGYSTRSVRGYQQGKTVFAAMASFQVPEAGPDYQPAPPAHLAPETLRSAAEALNGVVGPAAEYWSAGRSFDMRHVPGPVYLELEGGPQAHQAVWVKAFDTLPEAATEQLTADLHRAALAYVCDYTILESLLRVRHLNWSSTGLSTASLDHSMWFHRDGRADEWLLYTQEAVSAQSNRGLALGHFFNQQGHLLATVAQEGMIRAST